MGRGIEANVLVRVQQYRFDDFFFLLFECYLYTHGNRTLLPVVCLELDQRVEKSQQKLFIYYIGKLLVMLNSIRTVAYVRIHNVS